MNGSQAAKRSVPPKRPLRLLHLVYSLHTGGLENGVVNLCNHMSCDSFKPSICVFQSGGALESRLDRDRVELHTVRPFLSTDPTMPFRLAALLRRQRIDILHTHSWGTLVEGVTAAKLARTPRVIHGEHGVIEQRPRNIRVQRFFWSWVDEVAAVASPLADRMADIVGFPRERIRVIQNGVDTVHFAPMWDGSTACRAHFNLSEKHVLIGMVARLAPVKNHLGVVRALAALRRRGVSAALALAGEGPLRAEILLAANELDITEHVRLLGNITDVGRFLNALDIFVSNSHIEGMSNTIMEAMASGIPVVATSVGANSALVSHGRSGLLIPPRDDEALVDALEKLARDSTLRREMGAVGRERIEDDFSIGRMVQDYENLYRGTEKHVTPLRSITGSN